MRGEERGGAWGKPLIWDLETRSGAVVLGAIAMAEATGKV